MNVRKDKFLSKIYKRFCAEDKRLLFIIISVTGFCSSIIGFYYLDGYPYNFGKSVAGVFIPPTLSVFYVTYCSIKYRSDKKILIQTLILYSIQILPFCLLFFQKFQPTHGDDFERYYLYAKNMYDNNTLWGGDKLFFKDAGYYYVTQPGYRYFIYLELLLFKDLFRFVSFINIGIYILSVFYFQKNIEKIVHNKKLRAGILLLVFLFTPYAIKNLLMGLPEWITVIILICVCYLYTVSNKQLAAVFILGLVPFFRQNLLITVLLLFVWMLLRSKKKALMIIVFLIPLLLPIYHNLYYANKFRFFVDIFQYPFISYTAAGTHAINYTHIADNIIHYFGFSLESGTPDVSIIAVMFLPFATLLYFVLFRSVTFIKEKIFFLMVTMSAIVPIIFLGSDYYPRFEFVNVVITLVVYLLLLKPLKENEQLLNKEAR